MKSPAKASGWHIALFIFAMSIVGIPLSRHLSAWLGPGWEEKHIFRFVVFSLTAVSMVAFPDVRRFAVDWLKRPLPPSRRAEVAAVAVANVFMAFAFAAAMALLWFFRDGTRGTEALIAAQTTRDQQIAWAFSRSGLFILIAGTLAAPIIEELVFRGFLFKAWADRWGWRWSAVLTSAMFALYHPHFFLSFVESLVFIFVLRRTGVLAAPIAVHAAYNLAVWPPLMGQFLYPLPGGDSAIKWAPQLIALFAAMAWVPSYAWFAHRKPASAHALTTFEIPHSR